MEHEQDLLKRAQQFDSEALAIIFDRYYEPIYRYLYHHVHHVQTAEDLAGRVFQQLLDHLQAGNGPKQHLKAWMFRVAYHSIVDDSRRQQFRNHEPLDENTIHIEDEPADFLLVTQAYEALAKLPSRQRDVIILHYLMDTGPAEIADILELSVGAVKALQHRGLEALRRELRVGQEEFDGE